MQLPVVKLLMLFAQDMCKIFLSMIYLLEISKSLKPVKLYQLMGFYWRAIILLLMNLQ